MSYQEKDTQSNRMAESQHTKKWVRDEIRAFPETRNHIRCQTEGEETKQDVGPTVCLLLMNKGDNYIR